MQRREAERCRRGGSKVCDFGFPEPRGNPWPLEPTGTGRLAGCSTLRGVGWSPRFHIPHLSTLFSDQVSWRLRMFYTFKNETQQGNQRSSCGTKKRRGNRRHFVNSCSHLYLEWKRHSETTQLAYRLSSAIATNTADLAA